MAEARAAAYSPVQENKAAEDEDGGRHNGREHCHRARALLLLAVPSFFLVLLAGLPLLRACLSPFSALLVHPGLLLRALLVLLCLPPPLLW